MGYRSVRATKTHFLPVPPRPAHLHLSRRQRLYIEERNPKAKVGRAPKVVKGAKGRNPKAKVGRAPKVVKG